MRTEMVEIFTFTADLLSRLTDAAGVFKKSER